MVNRLLAERRVSVLAVGVLRLWIFRTCLVADDPFEGSCVPLTCWACSVLQASCLARFLLCLPRLSPGAWHLRACPVQRLSLFPGTPVLGSLLREYSGLRACSSWQPTGLTLELRGKRGLDSGAELFVELSCLGLGRRGVWSSSSHRPDSPLSHYLALRWFRSHGGSFLFSEFLLLWPVRD
ncbi:hypothetical protein Taro_019123 [Colocasia esculenta]|uniref:Uncharacterized protein n=1 Tax=Colocasia esculenta TaxID=4460 RepID=A0A843USZ4_COLES|nr:hypothetical protein [Colocasia esculenta]